MFKYLLKELGDPDWQFFDQLEEGVPVGVGVTMPRTPLVFDQKVKWALDEDSVGAQHEVENYRSLKGYEEEVNEITRGRGLRAGPDKQQLSMVYRNFARRAELDLGQD